MSLVCFSSLAAKRFARIIGEAFGDDEATINATFMRAFSLAGDYMDRADQLRATNAILQNVEHQAEEGLVILSFTDEFIQQPFEVWMKKDGSGKIRAK